MKFIVRDKIRQQFVIDHKDYPLQKRGGRGQKSSTHMGQLRVVSRIHIQLLPEQSIELTCPGCQAVRTFSKSGSHYLNLLCKSCIEGTPGLDAHEKMVEGQVNLARMLKDLGED